MTTDEEMTEYLRKFDTAYQEAPAPSYAGLPDGEHQLVIAAARIEEQEWGMQLCLEFQGHAGQTRKWLTLDDPERIGWTRADLERLGFTGALHELPAACREEVFIGLVCNVRVKTKSRDGKEYQNAYINGVVGRVDVGAFLGETRPVESTTDIPF